VAVAVKSNCAPEQAGRFCVRLTVTAGITTPETVTVKGAEFAVTGFAQGSFEVSTTVTTSLLLSAVVVKVELTAPPTFVPFICHWNTGLLPPFNGTAVKVTEVPEQIEPEGLEVTETDGTRLFTIEIVIEFELIVNGETHAALDVMMTLTTSLLLSVVVVKVEAVAPPTFVPFTCH
jgi:hypothetical protein